MNHSVQFDERVHETDPLAGNARHTHKQRRAKTLANRRRRSPPPPLRRRNGIGQLPDTLEHLYPAENEDEY